MAAEMVSGLTALAAAGAEGTDLLYIVDLSAGTSGGKKTTLASLLTLADNVALKFGTGADIVIAWDGTDLDVTQAAANSSIVWGVDGAGIDQVWHGDTASTNMTWDQSADSLIFQDNAKVVFGTGSDVTIAWDGTDLDITAAADNSTITIGAAGNSFDLVVFGSAAAAITFDTSANDLKLEDSVSLMFGTGAGAGVGNAGDVEIRWDATDLDVLALADDQIIKFGTGTNSFDLWWFGNTASTYWSWDASADSMKFEDNCFLGFGSNTAGPGTLGDINITWNATKLLVAQATANSAIDWGVDGAGIDQVWYGDTASTSMTWDQSADSLIFTGAARIVWTGTTGQPEIHLTDNLADALSIEISGSTDLLTFTTTNNAECVSPIGLRTRQTTAVAITGATELTLADSGGVFTIDCDAAFDIDLPNPTSGPGCTYFFTVSDAGSETVTITVKDAAATFIGTITIDGATVLATGSTISLVDDANGVGDSVMIRSLATNLYHVVAIAQTAGGITMT